MAEKERHGDAAGAFWSGAITFGLVSIQVDLYSAHRPKSAALRMVDRHGAPLRRRYFCPRDHKPLEREEIVRGYEIEEGRFILVSDEELEALEPKKSREIDLRCFVDAAELDPVYFEHAYFLLPAGSVSKPYRLLARIMENSGKAGIATFVMREREHLVAILAEKGILRAETLRFADEIRSPEDTGLPSPEKAPAAKVKQIRRAMKKLQGREFDRELLHDRRRRLLLELVDRKLKAAEDVVEKPPAAEAEGAEIIDLMEIIKKRFTERGGAPA
ncbi:MAG TPA: Ku protein [Desulfobacteraceae bacterium]|nr:Ku protein [Desulfobacteraceae bacterium]